MEAIRFAKLDFIKMQSQWKLLLAFVILAVFLSFSVNGMWAVSYLVFAGMIFSTSPFFSEILTEKGFFNLLPARAGSRMFGRYLYGSIFILLAFLLGEMSLLINVAITKEVPEYLLEVSLILLGVGLLFNSLQFLALSLTKIKNAQVLSLLRMALPFAVFFGGNALAEIFGGKLEVPEESIGNVVQFVMSHFTQLSWMVLGVGVLVTLLCSVISAAHEMVRER